MESIKTKMADALTQEFVRSGVPQINKSAILRKIDEESNLKQKGYLNYLKDVDDVTEIYNLIRSKKLSKNQIRTKLKTFLKEPQDLNKFLQAILDSKGGKKEETTEATGAGGSSGAFEPVLTGGEEEKIDTKNIPTVRESKEYCDACDCVKSECKCKKENKESTGAVSAGGYSQPLFTTTKKDIEEITKVEATEATDSSSSGQYGTPKAWAKSMSKKDWRGKSKTQIPGGKFVQVKMVANCF